MGHVAPGTQVAARIQPEAAGTRSWQSWAARPRPPAPHGALGTEKFRKEGNGQCPEMDAGSKSQTNSAAKTSRSQSPEPADGRDPCSAAFPHSPAPLCHADPPRRSPSAPWQVKCPERTPDLCSGCQLYFCLPSLPRENQPLSSSVAQPARSGAEARICMAEWIRQRLFLPAH